MNVDRQTSYGCHDDHQVAQQSSLFNTPYHIISSNHIIISHYIHHITSYHFIHHIISHHIIYQHESPFLVNPYSCLSVLGCSSPKPMPRRPPAAWTEDPGAGLRVESSIRLSSSIRSHAGSLSSLERMYTSISRRILTFSFSSPNHDDDDDGDDGGKWQR